MTEPTNISFLVACVTGEHGDLTRMLTSNWRAETTIWAGDRGRESCVFVTVSCKIILYSSALAFRWSGFQNPAVAIQVVLPIDYLHSPNDDSLIFGERTEQAVDYDEELKMAIGKVKEIPDLFYGLLQRGRVQKYVRGLSKTSAVRTTPFAQKHTECVFPFLISEAKSQKSGVSRNEIELQICFVVRETLLVQQSLASAANTRELAFEPLVWCVTYRGEIIHVTAACLKWKTRNDGEGAYGVVWNSVLSQAQCYTLILSRRI